MPLSDEQEEKAYELYTEEDLSYQGVLEKLTEIYGEEEIPNSKSQVYEAVNKIKDEGEELEEGEKKEVGKTPSPGGLQPSDATPSGEEEEETEETEEETNPPESEKDADLEDLGEEEELEVGEPEKGKEEYMDDVKFLAIVWILTIIALLVVFCLG